MQKLERRSVFLGIFIVFCILIGLWSWTPADFSDPHCKLSQNAAWVSVDWTSKPVDQVAVRQLAENAKSRKLKYLFPHISYLQSDRSFSDSYGFADDFVNTFRKFNKDVRILAWIGLPLANTRTIGVQGWIDLSDLDTREQIVQFIVDRIEQSEFDGVHINAETVQNNDSSFLNLLDEVRAAIGKDKMISVSGSHWVPGYINVLPVLRDFRWTSSYYQQVGQRAEQIATMTYDSYTFHPALYRLWMREQVRGISNSLENSDVELLIGISVSQEKTPSHQPAVESLANGLAGLCEGITAPEAVQGAAIYADWEFTQREWEVWTSWQR